MSKLKVFSYIIVGLMAIVWGCNDRDPDIIRANFRADNPIAIVDEEVLFFDLSEGGPTAWEWSFPGGSPSTSTEQNPVVVYDNPGVYTVELLASNSEFTDEERKIDYIIVGEKLIAEFVSSDTVINQNTSITFTDVSGGIPTEWLWDLGGGTPESATQPNTSSFYTEPGIFDISLAIFNRGDSSSITKPEFVRVMPAEGLVAQYGFNENAENLYGEGLDGTVVGATPTTDRYGNENMAYYFDGVDDYISVDNDEALENQQYTISAWIKTETQTGAILSLSDFIGNDNNCGYYFSVLEGKLRGLSNVGLANWAGGADEEALPINQWIHVAFTYDSKDIILYINGEEVHRINESHDVNYTEHNPLLIGTYVNNNGSGTWFQGSIDDVRIYNRALSANLIGILSQE